MYIQAFSVNHKTAPISIRELFSFTLKKQIQILKEIKKNHIAKEMFLLSTCNRTEFYLVNEDDVSRELVKEVFFRYLKSLTGQQIDEQYFSILEDNKAIDHLFYVTAGLESMVLGEDQILGQVKKAHMLALEHGASSVYLNTLLRMAVTASKKSKTLTALSKTPTSIATIVIKKAQEILGDLKGKKVLIIGATGQFGNLVLKDFQSIDDVKIFATVRVHQTCYDIHDVDGAIMCDYDKRYQIISQMDIVVSATSSPHFTIKKDAMMKIANKKQPIFFDLAVPKDIEPSEQYTIINIDGLKAIAEENNKIKEREAEKAKKVIKKYIAEFQTWNMYNSNLQIRNQVETFLNDKFKDEKAKDVFNSMLYKVRDSLDVDELENFFGYLKKAFPINQDEMLEKEICDNGEID